MPPAAPNAVPTNAPAPGEPKPNHPACPAAPAIAPAPAPTAAPPTPLIAALFTAPSSSLAPPAWRAASPGGRGATRSPDWLSAKIWLGITDRGSLVPFATDTYTGVTSPTVGAADTLTATRPCCGVATTLGVCAIGAGAVAHPETATTAAIIPACSEVKRLFFNATNAHPRLFISVYGSRQVYTPHGSHL